MDIFAVKFTTFNERVAVLGFFDIIDDILLKLSARGGIGRHATLRW